MGKRATFHKYKFKKYKIKVNNFLSIIEKKNTIKYLRNYVFQ